MITQHIIDQIKEQAVFIDWNVAFGGKAKGNQHLFRVVNIASFIAKKERANREICEASAWLHDVSLMVGNDDDPAKVRAITEEFLSHLALDDASKNSIVDCIETHEGAGEAASLEAKIVHDADVLDKMGLLGVIRHTWKIVNLIKPDASSQEVFLILKGHLKERQKKLYTTTAKRLVTALNEPFYEFFQDETKAIEMLEMIIKLAKIGTISDEIAKDLVSKISSQSLVFQLHISHSILERWYFEGETSSESAQSKMLLLQEI